MKKQSRHEKPITVDANGKSIKNPNQITINQHIIPKKHILGWSNDGKQVTVNDLASGEIKRLAASNPYFCVMRSWDQWTENNMLRVNEENYQAQIRLMMDKQPFTHPEHITAYYAMLCVRTWVANKERPDYPCEMTELSYECSKEELEQNEIEMLDSNVHIISSTLDNSSQHMARQVVKLSMNSAFIQFCEALKGIKWNIFRSKSKFYHLSDAFYNNYTRKLHILPVFPDCVLIADTTYKSFIKNGLLDVEYINELLVKEANKFYITA